MKRVIWWFFLSAKRYLRRPAFLAVLLILPVLALLTAGTGKKEDDGIRIAVCVEGTENELGERLAEELTGRAASGMFSFYRCGSEEALKEDVAARRAECGYVILDGLQKRLDAGDIKRVFRVYAAPSTVTAELSTETVFAALVRLYDKMLLETYVANGAAFEGLKAVGMTQKEAADRAGELYEKWLSGGGVFRFEYTYGAGKGEDKAPDGAKPSGHILPVRGLAAVLIFITGLYAAVTLCEDERRGLFLRLEYSLRIPCRLAALAAPAALAAVSGLLALLFGGTFTKAPRELGLLTFYLVLVVGMAWLLKMLVKSPGVIGCLIPLFLIGSLIFCPVFLDITAFVPRISFVGRLFLPYYYLRWF